jgi:hypothetical protein
MAQFIGFYQAELQLLASQIDNTETRDLSSGSVSLYFFFPDLIAIYLYFNSYNCSYSLHKFTTHKAETCLLLQYHFTSYLNIRSLSVSDPLLSFSISDSFVIARRPR